MASNVPAGPAGSSPFQPSGPYFAPGGETFPQIQQTFQEMVVSLNAILQQLTLIAPVLNKGSSQSAVTALAGGGQAGATQLSAQVSEIDTVATAGDSVALMASAPGLIAWVYNNGAHALQIYGLGADTINGEPAATGISIPAGHAAAFMCAAVGKWASVPTAP